MLKRVFVAAAFLALPFAGLATTSSQAQSAARPMCAEPQADARIARSITAEYPELARMEDAKGTALVQVDLLPTGDLAGVSIAKSSGNRYLDEAALGAARQTGFDAEIRDCAKVGGTYLVAVNFE